MRVVGAYGPMRRKRRETRGFPIRGPVENPCHTRPLTARLPGGCRTMSPAETRAEVDRLFRAIDEQLQELEPPAWAHHALLQHRERVELTRRKVDTFFTVLGEG